MGLIRGAIDGDAAGVDVGAALAFAHGLADVADQIALPAFRGALTVQTKSDGTWVTEIDRRVERRLRELIRQRYPDHAVLGEEDGRHGPEGAPTWIVDPIDGTSNYVKGNPIWATLIALQLGGRELLGVVSAPALGSRWDGVLGGPARQDGRVIHVSDVELLADAEVAFGGLTYFERDDLLPVVNQLARATRRQRGYGDFWQHCLVAAGSTDVALEAEVSLWDLAAVKAVVEA
ncbi:MAG TPA: inositol monophosphatase family protein, partial [Nitriliruptorales bacterium]